MKWLFRRPPLPAPDPNGTEGDEGPPPTPEVHPSPALVDLVQHLHRTGGALRILDLGPALSSNIDFLGRFAGRLQIADFHSSLKEDSALAMRLPRQPEAVLATLLPQPSPPGFDLILAWDLFDYLERRPLAVLGDSLTRLAAPGAHLFALTSIATEIAAEPPAYRIEGGGRYLRYEPRSTKQRACPRWNPGDLEELLPGFEVVHSYLLRHGLREHLLRRRGSGS